MNREQFITITGFEPVNDNLERANCDKAGQAGHISCGVCTGCGRPLFICGCNIMEHLSEIKRLSDEIKGGT